MRRPHLGRAGAGALLAAALILVAQAINSGAAPEAGAQLSSLTARTEALHVAPPAALPERPAVPASLTAQPVAAQPEIPLGRSSIHVPILMYHYIRENPDLGDRLGFNLSVAPSDFNQQLDWLAANGYHPVDLNDVREYFAGHRPLPAKPVVLTFDDGYRDMYTAAYPALRAHHFKAVSYVVTGFVGGPNYVTWDMVREMEANGIQIGAHTFSHIDLARAPAGELHRQLSDSESDFKAELGHPVVDFCYPAGSYNPAVVAAVRAAGYQTATTTAPGTLHSLDDRFTWARVRVSGGEPLDQFASDLGPADPTVTPAPEPSYGRIPELQRLPLKYAYAPLRELPRELAVPHLVP